MTDQDINRAIAEALGWKEVRESWFRFLDTSKTGIIGRMPGRDETWSEVPDYVNDLNAMHEAEGALETHDQANEFRRLLCGNVSATARQRAEAFLRTLGKWREA